MRRIVDSDNWPENWRQAYVYDSTELWMEGGALGYRYAYRNRFSRVIRAIERLAAPPATILDVAAAQGNFSLVLAERGYHVTWNDLRADLQGYVELKHQGGQVSYAPGNLFELKPQHGFDIVLAGEVIEHVAHPDALLIRLAELLNPGGALIITTPNGGYLKNDLPRFSDCADPSMFESVQFRPDSDGHIFLLHLDELYALAAKASLMVEEVALFNNPLTSGHMKLELFLRALPESAVHQIERVTNCAPLRLRRALHASTLAVMRKGRAI